MDENDIGFGMTQPLFVKISVNMLYVDVVAV